jgi:predicted outer membrane repeat protein
VFGSFAFLSFHGSTINDNVALGEGGGVAVHAEGSSFIDTRFEGNSAKNGGGFAAAAVGGGRFVRSTFIGNHARGFGGGLALETAAWLNETLILSNTADEQGGGIGFYGTNPFSPYAVLTNTVIADNQAGLQGAGMFIPSGIAVHLNHTTLTRNTGGDGSGITLGWYDWMSPGVSTLAMTDTILAYQDVGIQVSDASTVTVAGVLWFANSSNVSQSEDATVWAWGEHTGDPLFVNPDGGDYHIGEQSAARNMGLPSGVTWDLDGEERPMGGFWDLGADEFFELWFSLPLVFKN